MTALDHALKKAKQTKLICAVTRHGTGRGYESRVTIEVTAYPDLLALAQEIERLAKVHALADIVRGELRGPRPQRKNLTSRALE